MSAESTVPYFFCRLCPPPSWMLPPLMMPRPPMSKFSSMMITEAPVSLAAHAHASPETPAPTTTTSADRSHLMSAASASFGCSPAAATAIPAVPFATVVLRKLLRLTGFGPFRIAAHGLLLTGDDGLAASRLLYEHDHLRRLGHELLISWRKVVELKNERQDVHIRLVAQGIRIPQRHRVPYRLETFFQRFSVPLGPKGRTGEIHRLGVRCAKIASMAARATGLIRVVPSLRLRRGKHAAPDRRTGGVLERQPPEPPTTTAPRERPRLLSFRVSFRRDIPGANTDSTIRAHSTTSRGSCPNPNFRQAGWLTECAQRCFCTLRLPLLPIP